MRSLVGFALALSWLAGCGPSPCPTCRGQCGPAVAVLQRHGYEFRSDPNRAGGWHVYRGGPQVGYYRDDTSTYWPLDASTRTFGPAQALPWLEEARPAARLVNYGVDTSKLGTGAGESFRLNGQSIDRAAALQALKAQELPDDRHQLRLTVIGRETQRKRVLDDLASVPELAEFRNQVVVQDYPPDHWAVSGAGFKAAGNPTLYLQAPSGRVLHRQDDYEDGAAGLARALRRARPDYRPEADPDLRKDRFPFALPAPVLVSVGGLVLLLLLPR